jgi:leucyl aminopeptidase
VLGLDYTQKGHPWLGNDKRPGGRKYAVDIRISAESADGYVGDAVVVGVFEAAALSGPAAEVNAGLDGMIQRLIDTGEIRGKSAEVTILHTYGRLPAARVAAVGLGTATQADLFALRRASGAAARVLRDRGCRRVGTALHQALTGPRSEQLVRAVVEAAYVGLYRGEERKTQRALPDELDEIAVLGVADEHREAASAAARVAQVGGMATNYARRLVNLPANDITPSALANRPVTSRSGREWRWTSWSRRASVR